MRDRLDDELRENEKDAADPYRPTGTWRCRRKVHPPGGGKARSVSSFAIGGAIGGGVGDGSSAGADEVAHEWVVGKDRPRRLRHPAPLPDGEPTAVRRDGGRATDPDGRAGRQQEEDGRRGRPAQARGARHRSPKAPARIVEGPPETR